MILRRSGQNFPLDYLFYWILRKNWWGKSDMIKFPMRNHQKCFVQLPCWPGSNSILPELVHSQFFVLLLFLSTCSHPVLDHNFLSCAISVQFNPIPDNVCRFDFLCSCCITSISLVLLLMSSFFTRFFSLMSSICLSIALWVLAFSEWINIYSHRRLLT